MRDCALVAARTICSSLRRRFVVSLTAIALTHPDLQEVTVRWRGSFGYPIAWAGEGDENDEQIPLCRIEYPGDDEEWGFALYDPATQTYTPALLRTGQPTGHPTAAFDTAAIIYLADYQQ